MSDSWNDMRKAKEESYFAQENKKALERLKARSSAEKPRLSPITGKEMEQVTYMGVVLDKCTESGGIWLDAGELEQILEHSKASENSSWLSEFIGMVKKR